MEPHHDNNNNNDNDNDKNNYRREFTIAIKRRSGEIYRAEVDSKNFDFIYAKQDRAVNGVSYLFLC